MGLIGPLRLIPVALAAAFAASCGTLAPTRYFDGQCQSLLRLDQDNNDVVTQAEWDAFRTGAFDEWDADNDGRITPAEYNRCWSNATFARPAASVPERALGDPPVSDRTFDILDYDSDGMLDRDEFFASPAFAYVDDDRDLGVEPPEWE